MEHLDSLDFYNNFLSAFFFKKNIFVFIVFSYYTALIQFQASWLQMQILFYWTFSESRGCMLILYISAQILFCLYLLQFQIWNINVQY